MAIAARSQPQGLARINSSNPLVRGLTGAFTPAMRNATPVNGASLIASRDGIGYSTSSTSDQWRASNTALVSASPTWTILTVLAGTSTNTAPGGVPFYVERPNGTQIVKLEMGDGGTNTAALVVRDSSGSIILQRGNTDIRTDTGKQRVIVGTRRASNDHRIYVNGVLDAAATGNVGGSFGPTNAIIGCDPQDGSNGSLSGASLPLVLVWSRSLSDAEIAAVSANPWQIYESPSQTQFPQAAVAGGAGAALSGAASAVASATGGLTTSIPLAASAAVVASASASLSTQIALSGAASGAASSSAALSTQIPLSGSASAQASASATLTTSSTLSGTAAGSATASATLTTSIALSGAAVGAASASATLTTGGGMTASASAQASASATLTTHIALAGAAIAQAQASAALAGQAAALSGSAQCGASASATLTTGISLAAAAQAQASGQAALSTQIALVAIAQAQASASAQFAPTHPPTERVYAVNAESRVQPINPQSRAYVVDAQLRTNTT